MHTTKAPNALFFFNKMEKNYSFEFRKALRNHEIDLVVLSRIGRSVWEGLQIAGIINDKKLNTYFPKIGNCASACSFMFFAGEERSIEGRLGVHQFYSGERVKDTSGDVVEQGVQFTVSEIIGFLNEFKTRPWVYEKMFQQSQMYYFNDRDLALLKTEISDELESSFSGIETFMVELNKLVEAND